MSHQRRLRLIPKRAILEGELQAGDRPPAYDVGGLPADLAVEIAEIDGRWQLLVIRDGILGEWQGDFESAEHALAAIERELMLLDGSRDAF